MGLDQKSRSWRRRDQRIASPEAAEGGPSAAAYRLRLRFEPSPSTFAVATLPATMRAEPFCGTAALLKRLMTLAALAVAATAPAGAVATATSNGPQSTHFTLP